MPEFFGSSASPRWKEAAGGNSSTSRPSSSATGRASARTDAVGIDFSETAGRMVCRQAAWISSMPTGGPSAGGAGSVASPASASGAGAGTAVAAGTRGGSARSLRSSCSSR
jgi:hypothetical protein